MDEKSDNTKDLDSTFTKIGYGKFNLIYLLISGFLQSCDAIEMLILVFLGPILSCQWNITVYEQSFLTTSVFIGMLFGGPIFGKLCDIYGRKTILVITTLTLAYVGLLSSISPRMEWILICRALIGACLGGVMSSVSTLTSEVMPMKYRGEMVLLMFGFWPLGSFFVTTLCVLIEPVYGWRVFLATSTIPLLIALITMLWLPESPRYLLLKQRKTDALKVINRISKLNNGDPVKDIKIPKPGKHSIMDLIHPNYRTTTILCMLMWFSTGLNYYGIVLFVTVIGNISHKCLQDFSMVSQPISEILNVNNITVSCCSELTWDSYRNTYISTTGELFFIIITLIIINTLPRRFGFMIYATILALLFLFLNFCMSHFWISLILFILRGSSHTLFSMNFIYASEVFPTSVRSLGVGICNGSARIGAMIAPFIINVVIIRMAFLEGTLVFTFINIMMFCCAVLLPYETKNRKLYQTAFEPIEIEHDSNSNYEILK